MFFGCTASPPNKRGQQIKQRLRFEHSLVSLILNILEEL